MKSTSRSFSRRLAGFTIVEIMVAIAIIMVLAGLTLGSMGYIRRKQADSKAEIQIALISNALESYKADYGVYPPGDGGINSTTELREELHPPENAEEGLNKKTVYLGDLGEQNSQGWGGSGPILDPFGNPYRYESPGRQNPDFDLWSIGADEVDGTADDLTNW